MSMNDNELWTVALIAKAVSFDVKNGFPQVDITAPKHVEVATNHDGTVLWVNVGGLCVLRCCQMENLVARGRVFE